MHAQKSLQTVPSEAGPILLYVCKALGTFVALAQRAGNYRMKAGFMPWHSLSLGTAYPALPAHTEATLLALSPRGVMLCTGWKLPAGQFFL